MDIDRSVAEGRQKIQRLFGYLFLRSRFCGLLDRTALCKFFSDYIPQDLLESCSLFLSQDYPNQEILTLTLRDALQPFPRFPVIRIVE